MWQDIDLSLIDWSRAQFALTAMYHWLFVPLTLGLAVIMGVMETLYVIKKDEFWKRAAKFWMKLFGINFAIGVATGLILEFEFGTNWSNYSWFVGDIFGAPLAIEGIFAFFMESTFVAVMFFGWKKVSKGFHLTSTWLTGIGATLSAWWILVANAWMQHPVGMTFNPDTVRNEMMDFAAVALSPVAINKFFHAVLSGWVTAAAFVVGISCWYLLKKRETKFAMASIRVGAWVGILGSFILIWSGDKSGYDVAKTQPMKLAAFEGLYHGGTNAPLTLVGNWEVPNLLSIMATRSAKGYVPGIHNILEGGYTLPDGSVALSAQEKINRGRRAIESFGTYRKATKSGNTALAASSREVFDQNSAYFGYGYIQHKAELVPPVSLLFWSFRIMVGVGCFLLVFFIAALVFTHQQRIASMPWFLWLALWSIPLAYIAGQTGWIVAEVGRQPWAIQDLLPVGAAVSNLHTGAVQFTFFMFLFLFTALLIAELRILLKAIRKGPED
ncbi:MAG: cytochrome ubiquinol oxidase subunit I [Bacteroidaceae bacterium]